MAPKVVAKDTITLVNVNDAVTVSVSPSTCIIHADVNGNNHRLTSAFTNISATRGASKIPITAENISLSSISNDMIFYKIEAVDEYTQKLIITSLPNSILEGFIELKVTLDDYSTKITFQFSIERESSLVDWVLDWESGKTSIGGNYILTPKLYAGKIEDVDGIARVTGIYIGPDSLGAGLYGYNEGKIIFQINSQGALIGGWTITEQGIISSKQMMKILSEGSIIVTDENGELIWALYESGNAIFAKENIRFNADGSAYYKGEIEAASGLIAGWYITERALYKDYLIIDSSSSYIGISPKEITSDDLTYGHRSTVESNGGVFFYYQNAISYGLRGYLPKRDDTIRLTFSLGYENYIAGWSFDEDAIFLNEKKNVSRTYASVNSLTIGTAGLRGQSWYIDNDGAFSFVDGKFSYDGSDVMQLVGWKLSDKRFSTNHAALVSDDAYSGLYLSQTDILNRASVDLRNIIGQNTGIYLHADDNLMELAGYIYGQLVFRIGTEGNKIGGWNFNASELYIVDNTLEEGYAKKGCMVIGTEGIYAHAWRLMADGSGALANGNISWTDLGIVTIKQATGLKNFDEWEETDGRISDAWKEASNATNAAGTAQETAEFATTLAQVAQNKANAVEVAAQEADAKAVAAQVQATAANDKAISAENIANATKTQLSILSNDQYISSVEKTALKQQHYDINSEYNDIIADATKYGVDTTNYVNAFTQANAALIKYTATIPEDIPVEDDFGNIESYYRARTTILNLISNKAKELADDAQTAADAATGLANTALSKIEHLEAVIDQLNDDTILDIVEKNVLRTEWTNINGIESTSHGSSRGSYYITKRNYEVNGYAGDRRIFTYNGIAYTYNENAIVYSLIGLTALDAAYMSLREYLNSIELNNKTVIYEGFDRSRLASLLTDFYDAQRIVNDNVSKSIQQSVYDTKAELDKKIQDYQTAINNAVADLQDQIDGSVTTWFGTGEPTLNNYPAVGDPEGDWVTDEVKDRHIGDVYYDDNTGKAYRFQINKATGIYEWKPIANDDLAKALAMAKEAQDTADSKRRTFFEQPKLEDAYDPGDTWVNASYGDLYTNDFLRCKTGKASGIAFDISHWIKATNYTDDKLAQQAKEDAENAQNTADQAIINAQNAQNTANKAVEDAAAVNTKLTSWASDKIISPIEKEALKQQRKDVESEYAQIIADAGKYNVATTAFTNAYNSAITAFTKYTSSTTENIEIGEDYKNISLYYDARSILLQQITIAAKKVADDAQTAADAAKLAASEAASLALEAQKKANSVEEALASINDDTYLNTKEKSNIRIEWTTINGTPSTSVNDTSGTYYKAHRAIIENDFTGVNSVFTYNGITYTFNQFSIYYKNIGLEALDAAYLELREFLSSIQLNDSSVYAGFSKDRYAELLRNYYECEAGVYYNIAEQANTKADEALEGIELVKATIETFGSDNKISESEKRTLKRVLDDETQAKVSIIARATPYVTTIAVSGALANFNKAYESGSTSSPGFKEVIEYYINTPGNVEITSAYPLSAITTFYEKRQILIAAIDVAEKALIDSKDNTLTTINGGLITSGTIQLGDGSSVKAGITGEGTADTSVRIWAGATKSGRASAPFRVTQAGKMYATDAEISGKITASSGNIGEFKISDGKLKIEGGVITYQGYDINYSTVIQADEYILKSTSTQRYHTSDEYISMLASTEYGSIGLLNVQSKKTCSNKNGGYMGQPCCLVLNAQAIDPPSHRYDHAYIVKSTWGEFAGLRPAIRRIEGTTSVSDFQLSNMDYVVVVNKSIGSNSILFPLYPAVGQTYLIIKATTSGKITLNYNGQTAIEYNKKQYTYYDGSLETIVDVFDSSQTGIKQFIWDGAKWHVFTLTVSHTVHTYSNNSD